MTPRNAAPVVVGFHRFGPYHLARLRAAAMRMPVVGLELGTIDAYDWEHRRPREDVSIVTAFPGENPDQVSPMRLVSKLDEILTELKPSCVAIPGWGQRCALGLLISAKRGSYPTVLMSDSTWQAQTRNKFRESLKKRVVGSFDAALVAGTPHAEYAAKLGIPDPRIFDGFDVVDNQHFGEGTPPPRMFGRDNAVFLVVSRLISGKNIESIMRAFQIYLETAQQEKWRLRIVGDGPTQEYLIDLAAQLRISEEVEFLGFRQYADMPDVYAGSGCLINASMSDTWGLVVNEAMAACLPVLVSERCGCVPDLVFEGENGFSFDPEDVEALARLMACIADGAVDREAFGNASRRFIANWDLDRFAAGLEAASNAAIVACPGRWGKLDAILIRALLRK